MRTYTQGRTFYGGGGGVVGHLGLTLYKNDFVKACHRDTDLYKQVKFSKSSEVPQNRYDLPMSQKKATLWSQALVPRVLLYGQPKTANVLWTQTRFILYTTVLNSTSFQKINIIFHKLLFEVCFIFFVFSFISVIVNNRNRPCCSHKPILMRWNC